MGEQQSRRLSLHDATFSLDEPLPALPEHEGNPDGVEPVPELTPVTDGTVRESGEVRVTVGILDCEAVLDAGALPFLQKQIDQLIIRCVDYIILSLAKTRRCDLTVAMWLIGVQKKIRSRGGQILLVVTNQTVTEQFKLSGAGRWLPSFLSTHEAIESIRARSVPPESPGRRQGICYLAYDDDQAE